MVRNKTVVKQGYNACIDEILGGEADVKNTTA